MHRLLRHFGSMASAWHASPAAWRDAGLERDVAATLAHAREEIDPDQGLKDLAEAGVSVLTWADDTHSHRSCVRFQVLLFSCTCVET